MAKPIGELRCRREDNIKMDLRKIIYEDVRQTAVVPRNAVQ
jgi:hypothetical protein